MDAFAPADYVLHGMKAPRWGRLAWYPCGLVLVAVLASACSSEPTSPAVNRVETRSDGGQGVAVEQSEIVSARIGKLRERFVGLVPARVGQTLPAPLAGQRHGGAVKLELEPVPIIGSGVAHGFKRVGESLRPEFEPERLRGIRSPATVALPRAAGGAVRVQQARSRFSLEFAVLGANPDAVVGVADGLASYAGAARGGDIVLRPIPDGVEDFVELPQKPEQEQLDYSVKLEGVAGLRLYDNVLELLDETGDPHLRLAGARVVDADGTSHTATISLLDCDADTSGAVPWGRPVRPPGATQCTVRVKWAGQHVIYPALLDPVWTTVTNMATARYRNGAVTLASGNVLVCGGDNGTNPIASCEQFNPAGNGGLGSWATFTSLKTARRDPSLFLLNPSSNVLAVGGPSTPTAERFNGGASTIAGCAPGVWTNSGSDFSTGSFGPFMPAETTDGNFVVAIDVDGYPFKYTSSTNAWTFGTSDGLTRYSATCVAIPGQQTIMRAGGADASNVYQKTVGRYNPSSDTWSAGADLPGPRNDSAVAIIDSNRVMLYGGNDSVGHLNKGVVYSGSGNTWTATTGNWAAGLAVSRIQSGFTAAVHGSGKLLLDADSALLTYDATTSLFNVLDTTNFGFQPLFSSANLSPLGGKILMAPVTVDGSPAGPSRDCRVFDFGEQGAVCASTAECQSGLTCVIAAPQVTGVCCDTGCSGACQVCKKSLGASADGTCTTAPAGYVGVPACAPQACNGTSTSCQACTADSQCLATSYCAADGTCKARKAGAAACNLTAGADCKVAGCRACSSGFCSDGLCCDAACSGACDACSKSAGASADGKCAIVAAGSSGNPACAPQACNGSNASCAACTSDTQCTSDHYCAANGSCLLRKTQGAACNLALGQDCKVANCRACDTGNCVDGVCCDAGCGGNCDVCSKALGANADGTCTVASAGYPGSPVCAPKACTGASAACASCSQDTDCPSDRYCAADGTCAPRKAAGAACNLTAGADCKAASCRACSGAGNGTCTDGVCCSSACGAACDVCSKVLGASANGTCTTAPVGYVGPGCPSSSACNGTSVTCVSPCGGDADCVAGTYCSADGECAPRKSQGNTCNDAAGMDCKKAGCRVCGGAGNGHCSDGVCCESACNAACDVCSVAAGSTVDGTCSTAQTGYVGPGCGAGFACNGTATTCAAFCNSDADCALAFYCGKDQNCQPRKALGQTCNAAADCKTAGCRECAAASGNGACADGVCCDSDCNGSCNVCSKALGASADGTCSLLAAGAPGKPACAGGVSCDGVVGSCPGACTEDPQCPARTFCAASGNCDNVLGQGSPCDRERQCDSGFCVDGVCCDKVCDGQCEACGETNKVGICSDVKGQPRGARSACGGDASCEGSAFTPAPECNGKGACAPPSAISCGNYVCDGEGCLSMCASDADCSSEAYCVVSSGKCVVKRSVGSSCKADDECGSAASYCVDGVCCESACEGQCQSCSEADSLGSCVNVTGAPRGQRPVCAGDALCSGTSFTPRPECDGEGNCAAPAAQACGGYACSDQGCLTACQSDGDCDTDNSFHCVMNECKPVDTAQCSKDLSTAIPIKGDAVPCGNYVCDPSKGECRSECTTIDDCATGNICSPTKACVPEALQPQASDGGCGCRVQRNERNGRSALLALTLGAALIWRRRRFASKA